MKKLFSGLIFLIVLSGCSANMAANGQNGPDLKLLTQEYSRKDVERLLGSPVSSYQLQDGQMIAQYNVEARTEPSISRAAGHGVMDLFTLGLWELVGGPMEMYRGRRQQVTVKFDQDQHVVDVSHAPIPMM